MSLKFYFSLKSIEGGTKLKIPSEITPSLKFNQAENALCCTNEQSSETPIKPGMPIIRSPNLESFLVFPENNDTKDYIRYSYTTD